jgi:hypothetical protein
LSTLDLFGTSGFCLLSFNIELKDGWKQNEVLHYFGGWKQKEVLLY